MKNNIENENNRTHSEKVINDFLNGDMQPDKRQADIPLTVEEAENIPAEELKPKVVKIHDKHKDQTFFDKDQLMVDAEARELEDTVFTHPKPPEYEHKDPTEDHQFYVVDDFGRKVPSRHVGTVFNEFGVNADGQTIAQVLEEERHAKLAFEEYAKRHLYIQREMQKLKNEQKALDIEFKDQGLEVKQFKNAIKWAIKDRQKTEDEKWFENVTRGWVQGSKVVAESIDSLELEKEIGKDIGRDKETRQMNTIQGLTKKFENRNEWDAETQRGHVDNLLEDMQILATIGSKNAEDELIRLEESKNIREKRLAAGVKPLAIHDNSIRPANREQAKEVFGEEFKKRRDAHLQQQREDKVFDPDYNEKQWQLDYEPTDVPVTSDFDELKNHPAEQVKKTIDAAHQYRLYLDNLADKPEGNWVKEFEGMDQSDCYEMIKNAARVEDYLETKVACNEIYLPEDDARREDWDAPGMKIARHNRLVRTKKIPGNIIDYEPLIEDKQVTQVAEGI